MELHERDTEVLEQILAILKNHPEIKKFEVGEEPMVSLPGLEIFPSKRKVFRDRQEIQLILIRREEKQRGQITA